MPLLDLKTTLKDLKFTGPAPYVVKDINNPGAPAAGEVQARVDDVSRIVKMFADRPGALFTAKQALLQASQIQSLTQVTLQNTLIPVTARIGTILAQVPVNGTGTHFSVPDLAGSSITYVNNAVASTEAKYGGKVSGRRNSTFTNPIFKYRQLLDNNLNYSTAVGKTTGANLAERNGEVKITTFRPDTQNREIYGFSKQAPAGRSLEAQYKFAGANTQDAVNLLAVGKDGDDLVPLKLNILGNINSLLVFRGFYENISDTYNGTWTDTNYVGRAESLYTYSKFSRTIAFSFKVPIFSDIEQEPVYNKVNNLVSYTAPTYSSEGFPQGTILQLQVGDFIKTNGILTSVAVTAENNVPWSVGTTRKLLPQVLTFNVNFSIIHSQIPSTVVGAVRPYIAAENRNVTLQTRVAPRNSTDNLRERLDASARQRLEFGRELGQASNNFISGLGNLTLPTLSPRSPRPVIEVGDGTFGPPIFD